MATIGESHQHIIHSLDLDSVVALFTCKPGDHLADYALRLILFDPKHGSKPPGYLVCRYLSIPDMGEKILSGLQ
jgi:hypothetical protein